MTIMSQADLRSRLYEAYVSQHADCGWDESTALVHQHDIRPLLPPSKAGTAVGLGSGRGEFVRLPQIDSFDAESVDIGPEQVVLSRAAGLARTFTARVRQGDFRSTLFGPNVETL